MLWPIVKHTPKKPFSYHTFSDMKDLKQEILKDETQVKKHLILQ